MQSVEAFSFHLGIRDPVLLLIDNVWAVEAASMVLLFQKS